MTRAAKRAGAPYQHESLDTKLKKARSASPEPAHDVYEDLEHEEKNEREEEEEDEDEGDRTDAPLPEGYNNADEEQPEDGEGDSPADIDSNADALHPGYESEKERAGDYDDDPFAQIVDHYNEFRHDGASSDEDHDGEGDGFTGEREPVSLSRFSLALFAVCPANGARLVCSLPVDTGEGWE